MYTSHLTTPLGLLEIKADDDFVLSTLFLENTDGVQESENAVSRQAKQQLHEYFASQREVFSLPLSLNGSTFQQKVWTELQHIPYGKTISYLQLAVNLGDEKCIRAAATANGRNPFAIIVPCHRVIGKDGSLTGYAGGLWRKQWLLEHEGSFRKQTALF